MHWRSKWQPTPVFLPGEFQGWGSLVACHLWGRTELDTTEAMQQQQQQLLCLCCCRFSLAVASGSYSLVVVHGLLLEVASLVVEHRLCGLQ